MPDNFAIQYKLVLIIDEITICHPLCLDYNLLFSSALKLLFFLIEKQMAKKTKGKIVGLSS